MTTPTIDRRCHWLRKNRGSRRPELLVFVDTETNQDEIGSDRTLHTFKVGWACLARYQPHNGLEVIGWHEITDDVAFWRVVSDLAAQHKCTYIVSHNIDFDARVLRAFSIIPGLGWSPSYAILGESCRFFTFKSGKNSIALLDNLNYWRTTLATLGAEFGIAKMTIDFKTATQSKLSVYCHRDVEILVRVWDYWLRFLDKHDLGDFAITIAGQALRAFRHRFMHDEIGIHNRKDAIRLERESYKGGRCEVWKVGKFTEGPYYKLDINGLYAYVMRKYPTPRKLVKVLVNVNPDYLVKLLEEYQVIADVLLETDEPYYALHLNGFNVFPVGQFRATLTTWETINALEKGHLRGIGEVAIYTPESLFKSFIDYFTPLRQKYKAAGDMARSRMCKDLRNSLYGKFGQRGYKQKVIGDAPLDKVAVRHWLDLESQGECWDWTFGGKIIRQEKSGESEDSFPGIASHISAAGRCVLWDYAQKAGPGHVYYADTDSLIVDQAGYDNLQDWIDPLELGKLKLEGESEDLEIYAKKSYVFDGRMTTKGISKKAVRTADGLWRQTHFTSLKWAFKHGDLDHVLTYEVEKHMQNVLTFGIVGKNGAVTPPAMTLKQEDISKLIEPTSPYAWTWWIDVPWFQSLQTRKRSQNWSLLAWLYGLDDEEPPPGF